MTLADAADRLDRVVQEIVAKLRRGESAGLPGLGRFRARDGKVTFRRAGRKRRG
jgi:nucleoid DNA-binding protein